MPDEDKTFSGSFVLDLRIWWRQAHTLYWLLNVVIMSDWFASAYRVLTNQKKRIVSSTNQRQLRAFSRALESGYLFLFRFPIIWLRYIRWLSTFALVTGQSLQTRQTTRPLDLVKQSKQKQKLSRYSIAQRFWIGKHTMPPGVHSIHIEKK